NARLKTTGLLGLVGAASLFLMGQGIGTPEEIKAEAFTVVDDRGETRGTLAGSREGITLV
ncbi:MAG: hypothetical protein GTO30_13860, partial [Acidobacteria bacterium]|nr:hypothetical protein [Acidobacteriota bacterium]NIQ86437.1 hypothetical protein [Acidobacteriota bacterium]